MTLLTERHSNSAGTGGGPAPAEGQEKASEFQEQQAIAAAMMLGEQMRRENRSQRYFYVQRISLFVSGLSFMAMIMLYAYSQLSRGEFNPLIGLIFFAFVMSGAASVSYWAYTEMRRANED